MKIVEALLCTVALVGCSKSKSEDAPTTAEKATEATKATPVKPAEEAKPAIPEMPPMTGMFTCKAKDPAAVIPSPKDPKNPWLLPFDLTGCPSIPTVYGGADFGMDTATAGKAAKGVKKIESGLGYIYLGKHPFRQQYAFRFSPDNGKLESFSFKVDQAGFDAMKTAWGEPVVYTFLSDKMYAWFNPATKVKVWTYEQTWDRANAKTKQDEEVPAHQVYVVRYSPLADLLGEGLLGKPLIGKTAQEIEASQPGLLEIKTKEQSKADLDKLGLDKSTQAKAEALGAGDAKANLVLPGTETTKHQTLVHGDWDAGKLAGYSIHLPFGKDTKLQQELLAQVAAVLGKPTEVRKDLHDQPAYTFKGPNGLVVELELGTLSDNWHLTVHAPAAK